MINKLDRLGHNKRFLLVFAIGFVVRLVPELLSFPNPIGWDTIYYAYRIEDGVLFGFWDNIFSSWMIYAITIFLADLTRLAPFMLLKIVAPLLYGGASAGIYFVASKKLKWSPTKSLLASVIFAFSLASLAISWQFYRNIFGVMVLLFALPFIKTDISWKATAGLSLLGLLIAWGHELATLSLFFIIFGMLTLSVIRKEKIPYKLFVAAIPAILIFFGNYLRISPYAVEYPANLIWINDSVWAHPANLFFLTDYLAVNTPIETYTSYYDLFSQVGSLFIILYLISLPLIAVGYFKDRALNLWTILLLIGSLGCLIVPFAALLLWARWMLMLTIPFTFYATNGLWKATKSLEGVRIPRFPSWFKVTKKLAYGLFIISLIVGSLFVCWPLSNTGQGLINWPGSPKYFPSTMQSSSIPLRDTESVIEAYEWLNNNMDQDSSLIVHDVFEFWTLLYLQQNHVAYLFDLNLEAATNRALTDGYTSIYTVWWNQDINGHNITLPNNWVPIHTSGRIRIYKTQ